MDIPFRFGLTPGSRSGNFRSMMPNPVSTPAGPSRIRKGFPCLIFLVLVGAVACDDGIPTSRAGDAIPREAFIEAMVDLRTAALRRPEQFLRPGEAEPILERHGLTADDLREFVEVHGRNVPVMNEVWAEVERRLAARSVAPLEPSVPDRP